jgi:cytosine/adenosine deaminase-related metal-dependent hydrolase
VYDAIPYNGVLTHDAGVVVSYNSDSDELARHLTTEAGKAVKYGGMSEAEALKFVTINPARQLRIDGRVGSLERGKDADFVLWNGDPLSPTTICEQTWIDGRRYFDREEDRTMNETISRQRAILIQKALGTKKESGAAAAGPPGKGSYSCHEEASGKEVR